MWICFYIFKYIFKLLRVHILFKFAFSVKKKLFFNVIDCCFVFLCFFEVSVQAMLRHFNPFKSTVLVWKTQTSPWLCFLCRPTLSLLELLLNCVRSPTPGGVPAVRQLSTHRHMIINNNNNNKISKTKLFFLLHRFTSCSEDQSERNSVQTFWHHHPPEKTGKHLLPSVSVSDTKQTKQDKWSKTELKTSTVKY